MVNVVYILITVGVILSTVGDILGHCERCSVLGAYRDKCSTVGDVQYPGGYHGKCCIYL